MKRVSHTLTYPGTTVADVFAMMADPAYRKAVADDQHVTDFSCAVVPTGDAASDGGMVVRLEQAHAADRVPSFAQRLVGHEIRFVHEERWSSPAAADLHVTIPGKPGEMAGSIMLTQSGADVVWRIDLSVKVSIPLVGGKAEDLVAGFLGKAFESEHQVGVAWLRDQLHP